jgi:hypothetical protein
MGNEMKVVVARAPRIRKTAYIDIPRGDYFLKRDNPDLGTYIICEKDPLTRWIDKPFKLPYDIELEKNEVVPFGSFEDMCKWVAGGRKLEDLQGDSKSEWDQLCTLGLGSLFTEAGKTYQIQNFGLANDVTTVEAWCLETRTMVEFSNDRMVWPLIAGDTITITAL